MPNPLLRVSLLLVYVWPLIAVAQSDTYAPLLTASQRAWLAEHPVLRIAHDPNYPPLEFLDEQGVYRGISADYFGFFEQRLGVQFEIVAADSWEDVLRMAREREIDIVPLATSTEDRTAYLNFTKPLVFFPAVIIVRREVRGKMTIADLKGMRVGAPSGYSQTEYLNMVKQSADSLLRLLNDILDLSKIEAGKLDLEVIDFDLREMVGDTLLTISNSAAEKGLELAYHIGPDVPNWLVGDPTRLRQVVMNLTGNAIKFTDTGEVVVEVRVSA